MKTLKNILLSLLLSCTFVSCGTTAGKESTGTVTDMTENTSPRTITDSFDREVEIPADISRVVCIGAGALRLYSYVGDMNKLVGVEKVDQSNSGVGGNLSFRPYKMVNQDLFDSLPSCGTGGPQSQVAEAETILTCRPDVIFSLLSDVGANDTLQKETGIPVVMLSYGSTRGFDDTFKKTLTIMGDVLGREERSSELCSYIDGLLSDLHYKVSASAQESPRIYLGCNSFYGTKALESSAKNSPILNAGGVHNILDDADFASLNGDAGNVDMEYLVSSKGQPDKVILDYGGLNILKTNYAEESNAKIYNSLNAFKNGEVYVQMPYNAYYTNVELAYADAYFAGYVAHPDTISYDYVIRKTRDILTTFVGKDCYDAISSLTDGGFRKLDMAATFANYEK